LKSRRQGRNRCSGNEPPDLRGAGQRMPALAQETAIRAFQSFYKGKEVSRDVGNFSCVFFVKPLVISLGKMTHTPVFGEKNRS
jgi:hypothetical protein